MEFNIEEFNQSLTEKDDFRGQIFEAIQGNEKSKELLDKYAQNFYNENVGNKIGEVHGMYDKDFEEVTGLRKPEGVKTYNFIKEKVREIHEKAKSADPSALIKLQEDYDQLKLKAESGDLNNHFKGLYEQGKTTWEKSIQEKDEIINGFKNEKKEYGVRTDLNNALAQLTIREDIPESATKLMIKSVMDKYVSNSTIENDNSVTYYENDKPLMNPKTVNKQTAKEILMNELKDILAKKADGTGGLDNKNKDHLNDHKNNNIQLSSCKTRLELNEAINSQLLADGVVKGSDKFKEESIKLFKQYGEQLPLR